MGSQTVHWLKMGSRRVEQCAVGSRIGSKVVVEAVILLHYDDYMLNRSPRTRRRVNQGRLCDQEQRKDDYQSLPCQNAVSPNIIEANADPFRSFYFCNMFVEITPVRLERG
jgi:hypothetical protein